MHPNEAVQPAMRDPRARAPISTPPAAPKPHRARRLLRAFFSPLRWYVTEGRTPVAAGSIEVGHLPRPRFVPGAAPRVEPAVPLALEVCR